jgi:pimeloyl-ACP methyl ester carboxylesterase
MGYGGARPLAVDRIHGEVAGSGPPVVLTHDGMLHSESWDAQFGAFARDHRVARWDRRGYGRSPRPTAPFSSIDDLATVVRSVSDSPATLVGCSFGGFITIECALENPNLVAALVLVGAVVGGLPFTEHFGTRGGYGIPAPDAPVAEQIAYWSEIDPWYIAPANTGARQRMRDLVTANPHNLRPPLELERQPVRPALAHLGEITVPTLIVVGEHDIADVHAASGAIAAAIPGATRVVLPGAGHLPQLEVPDAFNQVVLDFLAGVREGQPAR